MNKVTIRFAASTALTKVDISEAKLAEFKLQCSVMYKTIVVKLQKRKSSQCNSSLVSQMCCLNPQFMINHPNNTIVKFEDVLTSMIENRFVKPVDCDDILKQYKLLLRLLRLEHRELCLEYDINKSLRIDSLFHGLLGNKVEYSSL